MQIGLLTDGLSAMPLPQVLDAAAELGIETVEIPTGNWSSAPHLNIDEILQAPDGPDTLAKLARDRGIRIEALNANGNPLHPVTGERQAKVVRDTLTVANRLGVDTVVMMSGLPAARGDSSPNWITTCWPPEVLDVLKYQWTEVAIPYWLDLVDFARECGVTKIALELHPHQLVYNVESFQRLRAAVGDTVGVNMDPSHLMWMGADPCAAVEALGDAVFHVHAKDTRIEPKARVNTCYETHRFEDIDQRAWNYVTLGHGHAGGLDYWRSLVDTLRQVGYNGPLSIEHEDASMSQLDGIRESVDFLRAALDQPAPATGDSDRRHP